MPENRFKELRERAGLKQENIARICGVGQSAISSWEVGAATPRPNQLKKLCSFYGVSADYILGISGDDPDLSDIEFALAGAIRDLSDAEKQDVLDYVRFKRAQKLKQQ